MSRCAVDRMACVDLAALPLQVLLRAQPEWRSYPVVVVDHDKPSGVIQWVNERARLQRILPGMRYAAGLALSRELRGGVVSRAMVDDVTGELLQRLWRFSPRVEPSSSDAGVFWLDASGLGRLYPSLDLWAEGIREDLREAGFASSTAVGFTRFGVYATAKAGNGRVTFQNPAQERSYVRRVSIDRLRIDPELRDTLLRLGVRTLGAFLDLPAEGIRKRFGAAAYELHQLARGEGWTRLCAREIVEPTERTVYLDDPESDSDRLMARIEPLLAELIAETTARREVVAAVTLDLKLDDRSACCERVAPAAPTDDAGQLLGLIRLRLEAMQLPSGVVDLTIRTEGSGRSARQLDLLQQAPHRDLDAADRAFARIRAELGDGAVLRARLSEGHLPGAGYDWEPMFRMTSPKPRETGMRPLVRRVYAPPIALPARGRHEPDGWLVAGVAEGPVEEVVGPHIVSGGWWAREVSCAYYYVRTRSGRWLWIYHDQKRRRWFLQGEVE